MIKTKVEVYLEPHPDIEIEEEFYVDQYNEEVKKIIYNWARKGFIDDIPDDKELEETYSLSINVGGVVFLCDLCGRENEELYFISFLRDNKTYDVCQDCYQSIFNKLEELRKNNLKWKTNIIGNK
jgi:hypothetical protein